MRENELASRQAALQKALSTALLNHQISELESKFQSIQVSKQKQPDISKTTAIATKPSGLDDTAWPKPGEHPKSGIKGKDKYAGLGRIDMNEEDKVDAFTHDEDIEPEDMAEEEGEEKWRVVVLDVSVLIWAPRSVRRLAAKGWELVVPLDAIRTLDLLKKGSSHSAISARSATRYIEHATRQYKHLSTDPSITVQAGTNYKRGTGIRLQRDTELTPITELSELPIPIEDVPRWAANVLGCAGWFARINDVDVAGTNAAFEPRPTLFVANPPLAVEALQGDDAKDQYAERGEGYLISQEAERFELALVVLRDEETEDMSFEADAGGRRGRGRGKGPTVQTGGQRGDEGGRGRERGGGGGQNGRGKHERKNSKSRSEEPEREVKILLRRPTPVVVATTTQDDKSTSPSAVALDAISVGRQRVQPMARHLILCPTAISTAANALIRILLSPELSAGISEGEATVEVEVEVEVEGEAEAEMVHLHQVEADSSSSSDLIHLLVPLHPPGTKNHLPDHHCHLQASPFLLHTTTTTTMVRPVPAPVLLITTKHHHLLVAARPAHLLRHINSVIPLLPSSNHAVFCLVHHLQVRPVRPVRKV